MEDYLYVLTQGHVDCLNSGCAAFVEGGRLWKLIDKQYLFVANNGDTNYVAASELAVESRSVISLREYNEMRDV